MVNGPQEQIGTTIQGRSLPFQATNIPDANVTANTIEPTSPEYIALYDGCVVGLSARHNAALASGSLAWSPTINGTAKTALTVTTSSTVQSNYGRVAADVIPFKAGDRIGLGATKSGTISATTTDVAALLDILWDGVGQ